MSLSGAHEPGLTSRRQPECGDAGIGEEPSLHGAQEGLCRSVRSVPDLPAVNHRWQRATHGRVPAPVVVVLREVSEDLAQVVQASNERNVPEPFLLQCQDRALGDRDGTMLAHRTEPVLDVPVRQQFGERFACEDALLVADQMPGRPVA